MLNYFVDVGTNTNYDCFNTYLGKYYNKTKLDCLEQFLWEQQELKAELQYKLQEHPDSRVAVYKQRPKIFQNIAPEYAENDSPSLDEDAPQCEKKPMDPIMLEIYLNNTFTQRVFQFKLTQQYIN